MTTKRFAIVAAFAWERAIIAFLLFLPLSGGCGSSDPFAYMNVSGKVAYEDGSLIPVDAIVLKFYPQGGELNAKTHPRPGMTIVDVKTGRFSEVTSNRLGDGLVKGKHKVVLLAGDYRPLPPKIASPEYYDPFKTPLEVDTANQPFDIRIKKP